MISLRRPVSRRVNRIGGSDDPKLIAEVTLAGTRGSETPASLHSKAGNGDAECERAYAMRAKLP
jgi:hypothetical protein